MTEKRAVRPLDCTVQVHDDAAAAGRRRSSRNVAAGGRRIRHMNRVLGRPRDRRRQSLGAVLLLNRFETHYVKQAIDDKIRSARWVRHSPMLSRDDCCPMHSTMCQGVELVGWVDRHSLIFWICAALMTEAITAAEAATAAEWESVGTYPAKHTSHWCPQTPPPSPKSTRLHTIPPTMPHNVASPECQVACDRSLCQDRWTSAARASSAMSKVARVSACCAEFDKWRKSLWRTSSSRGA